MMNKARRVIFMLIAVMAFVIPSVKSAEAALWHPSSTGNWSISRICPNRVQVTWRSLLDVHKGGYFVPYEMDIIAYESFIPGGREPQKLVGDFVLGKQIGSVHLVLAMHDHPLQWIDDEGGTGTTYVYDIENIYFLNELPLGESVIVGRGNFPSGQYFLASVTDCTL